MKNNRLPNLEQVLIRQCIAGDGKAQKELYQRYLPAMYNRAVRMLGNREDAKDAIQEAFAQAFRDLSKFRGDSTFGAWMKVITINKCLSHLKIKQKHLAQGLEEQRLIPNPEDETDQFDIKRIHYAMKQLPKGCRTIFNLYLIEGYKHSEIAEILEISESTSKTQYRRAKRLLRELLKKEWA